MGIGFRPAGGINVLFLSEMVSFETIVSQVRGVPKVLPYIFEPNFFPFHTAIEQNQFPVDKIANSWPADVH